MLFTKWFWVPGILATVGCTWVRTKGDETGARTDGEVAAPNGDDTGTDTGSGAEESVDADGDGWRGAAGDCDDADPEVHPGADEWCNGRDDDCDGEIDEDAVDGQEAWVDADGDGWGEGDFPTTRGCDLEAEGLAAVGGDCDDTDPDVNPGPGVQDVCGDEIDDNCDGWARECTVDVPLAYPDARLLTADGQATPDIVMDAGDFDGDGVDDLLLGVTDGDDDSKHVVVVNGPVYGPVEIADLPTFQLAGEGEGVSGQQLAAGDVNGDGFADALLSDTDGGFGVLIALGPIGEDDALFTEDVALHASDGPDPQYTSFTLSDVDGDGLADLLYGDPSTNYGGGAVQDAALLVYGPLTAADLDDALVLATWSSWWGWIDGGAVGDLDGDGVKDVAIGAPYTNASRRHSYGAEYVVHGPVTTDVDLTDAEAGLGGTEWNNKVGAKECIGDLDGDGYLDLAVTFGLTTRQTAGGVAVLHGPITEWRTLDAVETRIDGELVWLADDGVYTQDSLGAEIRIGDVDGDGFGDLLVGAPYSSDYGRVLAFSAPVSGVLGPGDADHSWSATDTSHIGDSFLVADLDGLGGDDILVGNRSTEADNRTAARILYMLPE